MRTMERGGVLGGDPAQCVEGLRFESAVRRIDALHPGPGPVVGLSTAADGRGRLFPVRGHAPLRRSTRRNRANFARKES